MHINRTTFVMNRYAEQNSKKAIFIALLVACVVGSTIMYFSDIKALTSMFLNTKALEYLEDQQDGTMSVRRQSLENVSEDTTTYTTTAANQRPTALSTVVFSNTTTRTYNKSLVAHCKESIYIDCSPRDLKPIPGKIFKIVYLRTPSWLGASDFNVTDCKINQCVVQNDKVANDTDLVIVYGVGLSDKFRPPQMWPDPLFGLHVMESPVHTHSDFIRDRNSYWGKQMNIIMTYRVDSEIFNPYARLMFNPKPADQRPNYYEIAKNKTRTAAWFVSNCKPPSRREVYVAEMQKYIDVDIFGSCGTPCSEQNQQCENWHKEYKFYLSFENSLCTDYITEKFFKIFAKDIFVIPVVRGGADYDKHFPNSTYINAAHFKTPKDLALHLKHLASDLETYSKYLEYKDMYTLIPYRKIACHLCEYVHTHKLPEKSRTHNLKDLLVDNQCHAPTDL